MSRLSLDFGGIHLQLESTGTSAAELASWHFGRLPAWSGLPDGEPARDAIDVAITVTESPITSRLTSPRPISQMMAEVSPSGLRADHVAGGRVEATASSIVLTVWAVPEQRWICTRQLLFLALTWVLAQHDRALVHAATVASNGHAALVLGTTGSGKSTFAAAALRTGWEVHGDDLVVLHTGAHGALCAYGVPKRLSFPAAVFDSDLVAQEPVPADPRHRRFADLNLLQHGRLEVAAVIVAGHDEGTGQLLELSSQEVLEVVIQSFGLSDEPEVLRRVFPALVALSAKPGYSALHARDVQTRTAIASRLLEQTFDAAGAA